MAALLRRDHPRHEALRTTFEEFDGQPVQVVAATAEPDVTVVDCTHLTGGPGRGDQALARTEFARPFDLRSGPLLRTRLLRLARQHILLLTLHHIVADRRCRWRSASWWPCTRRWPPAATRPCRRCRSSTRTTPAGSAGGPRTRPARSPRTLDYWTATLAGAPPALELPTDRPRPPVQTTRGGSPPFELTAGGVRRPAGARPTGGRHPFMVPLAAFTVLLHRYSGEDDVVVGVPVANRDRPEIERLIGFFVNTLALRTDLAGNPSFRELLGRVRPCLGGYAHQQLPFERLVEALHPARDLSRSPVFQVSFLFQNIPLPDFDVPGLHWSRCRCRPPRPGLTSSCRSSTPRSGSPAGSTTTPTSSTPRPSPAWPGGWRCWWTACSPIPTGRSASCRCCPDERSGLVEQGTGPAREWPGPLVPALVAARAADAPTAAAVGVVTAAGPAGTLSYAELDRAPTGWRTGCAGSASAGTCWWASVWSVPRRW